MGKDLHGGQKFPSSNIDFLRLLLASLVIVTHSYPLSGLPEEDLLYQATGGQFVFSYLAVRGFFVLSGFLIFKSLQASSGLMDYAWKRSLRILPAYWLVILITVFVVGPLVADIPVREYFSQASTWAYLKGTLTFQQIFGIDHVLKDVPYPAGINGSLWTIPYEVLMYVVITPLFFLRKNKQLTLLILSLSYLALVALYWWQLPALDNYTTPAWGFRGVYLVDLAMYFLSGSLLAVLRFKWKPAMMPYFLAASLALILTGWLGGMRFAMPVAFPLWIMMFAQMSFPIINRVREIGDFSYGIYLYGFLIQQLLMHFFRPGMIALTLISIVISILVGGLSWHLLEKRALALKDNKWWKRKASG